MTVHMRVAVTVACLLAQTQPAEAQGVGAREGTSAEQEVRAVQGRLIAAYQQRDLTALDRILAPEYTFVESHGRVLTKAEVIENFSSGDRTLISYVIDDDHVLVYGNAAIMTYHYAAKERYRGRDEGGDFRFLRVFAKGAAGWQMVAGQETRLTPP